MIRIAFWNLQEAISNLMIIYINTTGKQNCEEKARCFKVTEAWPRLMHTLRKQILIVSLEVNGGTIVKSNHYYRKRSNISTQQLTGLSIKIVYP